jgi:hypothetical protein
MVLLPLKRISSLAIDECKVHAKRKLGATAHEELAGGAGVEIHPFEDGLIAKVLPPKEPQDRSLDHIPCDIVLVVDVSGSMGADAPVPTNSGEVSERNGLSVLDLTKHAAKTILETLDAGDRLGIVTFASKAKVCFMCVYIS